LSNKNLARKFGQGQLLQSLKNELFKQKLDQNMPKNALFKAVEIAAASYLWRLGFFAQIPALLLPPTVQLSRRCF